MDMNFCSFRKRDWRISLRAIAVILAFILLAMGSSAMLVSEDQTDTIVKLSVDEPRPVAKAMELLQSQYGWVITYEDPRYVHESDLMDVAYKVRKDFHKYEPGKAPKLLVPRNGPLNLSYEVSPETGRPEDPAEVIQTVLNAHAANGNPGLFRLEQTGEVFHVVPAQVKDRDGRWVEHSSILDVPIILAEQERSGWQLLNDICREVSRATQTRVEVGTIPTNLFIQKRSRIGAAHEPASDVLLRLFQATKRKLTWRLLYSPDAYALNVRLLPEPASPEMESPPAPVIPDPNSLNQPARRLTELPGSTPRQSRP